MSLLDRIKVCNNGTDDSAYAPFVVEGQRLGWVHCDFAPALKPFDDVFLVADNSVTLLADLDAGATGTMTSALMPDQIRPVVSHHLAGDRQGASDAYVRVLPAINYENRQCGLRAAKVAMAEGGVIASPRCRHPLPDLPPQVKAELLSLLQPLDPVVLSWGR